MNVKNSSIMTGIAALSLAFATTSMAQPLVNGGFETGDTTGWTETLSGSTATVVSTYAHSGTYSLLVDSTGAGQWSSPNVWQSFSASPGTVATMDGWMYQTVAANPLNWATIKLEWKDVNNNNIEPGAGVISGAIDGTGQPYVGVIGLPQVNSGAVVGSWVSTGLQAIAPAGTVKANFYLLNVNGDAIPNTFYFDDISASVPEPTTFALAGLGAAALLIFRRRS
jgi:hypothetical protein